MSALTEEAVSPFTIRMVQWLPIFTHRRVTQYYAMERFLYRLSTSPHVEIFTLSGALLLTAWQLPSRPSMDIDLCCTDNAVETIAMLMREISHMAVADVGALVRGRSGTRCFSALVPKLSQSWAKCARIRG